MDSETKLATVFSNNHTQYLTNAVLNLLRDNELRDVTLVCEEKSLLAHKMLLSAFSPYFRDIFKVNKCKHPVVLLINVEFEDVEAIVNFLYHGMVEVKRERLNVFFTTAKSMGILLGFSIDHFEESAVVDNGKSNNDRKDIESEVDKSVCPEYMQQLTDVNIQPPKAFKSKSEKIRKSQHNKKFMCFFCNIWFAERSERQAHALNHKDVIPFKCSSCPITYLHIDDLQEHIQATHF